jgi:phosphatidylglycerol:prolipoprotein diacylglycerol transferase
VVGAKLLLYILDWRYYFDHPAAILSSLRSAGVWYGGLLVAVAACVIAVRRRGLNPWQIGDIAAPAISLGQAIGRLGCLAAGCCYGKACSLPWAVTFTNPRAHEITGVPLSVPLHPTQIYHALADFALFLVLLRLVPRRRFNGQALLVYLILYAILRTGIEALRGDPRGALGSFSTSQILGVAIVLVAAWLYAQRARAAAAAPAQRPTRRG